MQDNLKILAFNTATKTLSLALVQGEKLLHSYQSAETRDQGNILLEHAGQALTAAGLAYTDIDAFAVVTGPGSFTGIRLGLATARGLGLATGKPVLGFSSFDMFAAPAHDKVNIVAVESWRRELYFAVLDEEGHALIACGNEAPEDFAARLKAELPGEYPFVISGDAAATLAPLLPQAEVSSRGGDAADVAKLAAARLRAGGTFPEPLPYYLRPADITPSKRQEKTLKSN